MNERMREYYRRHLAQKKLMILFEANQRTT